MTGDDLTELLRSWPFEPGRINTRLTTAADGRALIQVRIELGVLQMEATGRPDGVRPEGSESLLDHHSDRLEKWIARHGSADGFVLSPDECTALREEAVQYYHRYVALLVLEEFDGVIRDTTRNLRAIDLCSAHGATEIDRTILEQFRPYVLMMRTRAEASQAIGAGDTKAALVFIDAGLEAIRAVFEAAGNSDAYADSNEVRLLQSMREMLVPQLPASQRSELAERLRAAIEAENYELAAILRDELRMLDR